MSLSLLLLVFSSFGFEETHTPRRRRTRPTPRPAPYLQDIPRLFLVFCVVALNVTVMQGSTRFLKAKGGEDQ